MPSETHKNRHTRRELIGGVFAAGALALAQGAKSTGTELYDCIVIGAGVAGLAAAKKLHQAGQRVVVVEATTSPRF